MAENVFVPNPEEFEQVKSKIYSEGAENLHVVADFDRTLTKAYVNGKKVPSIISLLRSDEGYLGKDYMDEATRLANTYMPYESDERLSLEDKKGKMYEWWSTHYGVLKEKGLSRSTLDKVADDMNFAFREGALEFMDYLNRLEVPMLILSSSGIGNCIENFLEREGRNYDNIYVISNFIEFDEKGYMTGIKGGIIHPFNKGEVALKEFPKAYDAVKDRKNVLLLGDSRGDANMAGGPEYRNISRFGFLNDNVEESIESYKQTFDVVLTHDTDMDYINDILKGFEE